MTASIDRSSANLAPVSDSSGSMALPFEKRYVAASQVFPDWLVAEPVCFPPDHLTYAWQCRVPDCDCAIGRTGNERLCPRHAREYRPSRSTMTHEEFAKQASKTQGSRGDWALHRYAPCVICGPLREQVGAPYCAAHLNRLCQIVRAGGDKEEWLKQQSPHPALAVCSIGNCVHDGFLKSHSGDDGARLCASHFRPWRLYLKQTGTTANARTWTEWLAGNEMSGFRPSEHKGQLVLAHLPERIQCEVRYALHHYAQQARRTQWRPSRIQKAVDQLADSGITTLSDPRAEALADEGVISHGVVSHEQGVVSRRILHDLIVSARGLTVSEDDAKEAGWFDPVIVGTKPFRGPEMNSTRRKYWDLRGISQRWLRDLMWDHLRHLAVQPVGKRPGQSVVSGRLVAVRLFSKALRHLRDDPAGDPSALTAADAAAFKELWNLWCREQIPVVEQLQTKPPTLGPITPNGSTKYLENIRLVLAFGRDEDILGQWVNAFVKVLTSPVKERKAPKPRPISDADFAVLVSADSLQQLDSMDLSGAGLSDIWLTHALQGGRISETLNLRLGCIGLIGEEQPYLWRDISKVGAVDYGMPCYLPIYERLVHRREVTLARLRKRYARDLEDLNDVQRAAHEAAWGRTMPLFPGAMANPDLKLPFSYAQFRSIFSNWLDRIGLANLTSHRTRATLATALLNNGAPPALVRQLLGHFSESAMAHYARYNDDNLIRSLQQVWTAGPGMDQPGQSLMTPATASSAGTKSALGQRIDLTVIPVEHGLCRYGPVVGGKSCPKAKNCSRGPQGPCPHFVLTGADLSYWERKRDAAYHFAEAAPSDEARDYILSEWESWDDVLAGLRQTLDEFGLLKAAEELDLRTPMHDFFNPLFSNGWTLVPPAEPPDEQREECA